MGIHSASIACCKQKFLQCCHFSEISGQFYHKTFSQNILRNSAKHGKYCEICDMIETYGKDVKYVKYVIY